MRRLAPLLPSLLALAAAPAAAEVDVEIRNGARVAGALYPATEAVEAFRVRLPRGARLVAALRSRGGRSGAVSRLVLRDAAGGEVASAPLRRGAAKLRRVSAPASAEYTLAVEGEAAGPVPFRLRVHFQAARRVPFEGDLDAGPVTVPFSAEAGSVAAFEAAAARDSLARPWIAELAGPVPEVQRFFPRPGAPAPMQARVEGVVLPVVGDHLLTVRDAAALGGAVEGAVRLRPPPRARGLLDLSDRRLGAPWRATGRVVGPAGGRVELVPGAGLAAASVVVAPGGLASYATVVLGTGAALETPRGLRAAGPTLLVEPGSRSSAPLRVTLPFDPRAFRGDGAALRVHVADFRGRRGALPRELYVVDGAAGTVSFDMDAGGRARVFETVVASDAAADLNGDGFGDLVLRAPLADGERGAVHVHLGGPGLEAGASAGAAIVLRGAGAEDRFGASVAASDFDGDGLVDLAVGAPGAGRVYVFRGAADLASRGAGGADFVLAGRSADAFGSALAAGDLTGDGAADLVVAAEASSAGARDAGAVHVFRGGPGFGGGGEIVLTGARAEDVFGTSVAVGDVTGDGVLDLVVGADQGPSFGTGRAYVFAGGDGLKSGGVERAAAAFSGEAEGDAFGRAVAAVDLDGDGAAELCVGAPGVSARVGAVYLFRGGLASGTAADAVLVGDAAGEELGSDLASGELTGDGRPDLAAAAAGHRGFRGRVDVFPGGAVLPSGPAASAAAARLEGESGLDEFAELGLVVDVTGDGAPDLLVGAPWNETLLSGAGAAYLFAGPLGGVVGVAPAPALSADVVLRGALGAHLGGGD